MRETIGDFAGHRLGGMDIVRVVYASRARIDGPVYAEMERIRRSALRHNVPLGICTALLWQSGWFLQWKEGPWHAMEPLMARVAGDPRHEGLCVVHASAGTRLLDGPWSMGIVAQREPAEAMAQRVALARAALDASRQHSPPEVWRRLSMPGQHGEAAGADGDPEAYQRLLMASSVGITAFDLVRWLARERRAPLQHRRFAGLDLDVATESVDFRGRGGPLRAVAMARKGLALPLTRALLRGYSHLVLLLCDDAARNRALLERVGQACATLCAAPSVVGVGLDAQGHHELFAQARRQRLVYLDAVADPRDFAGTWSVLRPLLRIWRDARRAGTKTGLPRAPAWAGEAQ